jgi:hypothetical protein
MERKQILFSANGELYDKFVQLANDKELWRGSKQSAGKAYESALDTALICFINRTTSIPTDLKERKELAQNLTAEIELLSKQLNKALRNN